ncbi:hypothetical protein BDV95DRAFT_188917 [Massariosphaeria phaeospora]|uniref:Uncharacterized protein n=1 Tax=Massariosphaeria phaeospora TaxID=100035 RepID=A0A7C8I4W5_9PLEO|nr:hypothetical protein BDV95DRAFT_188917 [Massariosphaeria phaeospora]
MEVMAGACFKDAVIETIVWRPDGRALFALWMDRCLMVEKVEGRVARKEVGGIRGRWTTSATSPALPRLPAPIWSSSPTSTTPLYASPDHLPICRFRVSLRRLQFLSRILLDRVATPWNRDGPNPGSLRLGTTGTEYKTEEVLNDAGVQFVRRKLG